MNIGTSNLQVITSMSVDTMPNIFIKKWTCYMAAVQLEVAGRAVLGHFDQTIMVISCSELKYIPLEGSSVV